MMLFLMHGLRRNVSFLFNTCDIGIQHSLGVLDTLLSQQVEICRSMSRSLARHICSIIRMIYDYSIKVLELRWIM